MKLTKEQTLGIVRHILTFAGGTMLTSGLVDQGTFDAVVGSVITLAGVIWSITAKKA